MQTARPPAPARDTGLPPGVRVGPLGQRLLAYVIDSVVPALAGVLATTTGRGGSPVLVVVAALVALAWGVFCWQQLVTRAATPGMRLLKLQLVGFFDGRPLGWGRVFVRWVVFTVLGATGLGLLLLVVSIFLSPRHQGWHDRAASGVVIVERPLAPRRTTARSTARPAQPQDAPAPPASTDERDGRAVAPAPVASPVAGDPAVGPELAPLAAAPADQGREHPGAPVAAPTGGRRTILDGWVAELDDGREIPVRGLVLIGRNPQPEEGESDAELVKLPDESRTVSKTHLALGVDDAGLFVVDRGSTNGSVITEPGREAVQAGAFHAVSVSEGTVVSVGDHWVRIRRDAR